MKKNLVLIGTSGWSYKQWSGIFYPDNIKEKDFLKYYSEYFDTVEVNSSFYHTLNDKTIENWVKEVHDNFKFAVKADRYITHMKKLLDPDETIPSFMSTIKPFKDKVGPILFQLPPSFGINIKRLKDFIKVLSKKNKYVFEFRNKDWFTDEIYDVLKKHNIALCIYNLNGYQSPLDVTADFVYIRMHGTLGIGSGKYSDEDIDNLAQDIEKYISQNKTIYCYFNNDGSGYAVENANELKKKLKIT